MPVLSLPPVHLPVRLPVRLPARDLAGRGARATRTSAHLRRTLRARGLRLLGWTLVLACGGAYATSLAVPLWFEAQGERLLVVTSDSMAPAFRAGDAVVLREVADPSQLRVGQVVSYWPQGSDDLVTHRIEEMVSLPLHEQDVATGRMVPVLDPATGAAIERPYLYTRGDANADRDADAVPVSRVRGVVLGVHEHWGSLLAWAHSALGRLILLAPPLLVLAAMELTSVVRARRSPAPAAPAAAGVRHDALLG